MYIDEHIDDINFCIKDFDIDESNYTMYKPSELGIKGDDSNKIYIKSSTLSPYMKFFNKIYIKSSTLSPHVKFYIDDNVMNSKIFIGKNILNRSKLRVRFQGNRGLLYIGDDVTLSDARIYLSDNDSYVCVGNRVNLIGENNIWKTGTTPKNISTGIIVGDDCLIAGESTIRASDEHLVIDLTTNRQTNISHTPVILEPYCWFGQRTTVLKNCRIGACSISGFAAVITKSSDRFSVLAGVPAKAKSIDGKLWLRNNFRNAKIIFEIYKKRFITEAKEL